MKILPQKRSHKLLVVLLAVVFVGLIWQILQPLKPEPIYQGKPESFWINKLGNGYTFASVRELGPDLVPVMLKAVDKRGDSIQKPYQVLWSKLPAWLQQHLPQPVNPSTVRSNAANIITGDHQAAIRLLKSHRDPVVRRIAAFALFNDSSTPATLALIDAAKDKDAQVRGIVGLGLGLNARDQSLVVPAVIPSLLDSDPEVRSHTVGTLNAVGIEITNVVSALEARPEKKRETLRSLALAAKSDDPAIQDVATMWLRIIDSESHPEADKK